MSYPCGGVQVSAGEEATMRQLNITAVRSEALFVSTLQRSDHPGAEQVWQAIAHAVREFGSQGCAARVAQEFGDHPELAVARMRWARRLVDETFNARQHAAHVHGPTSAMAAHVAQAA
jgi:hypothetical protein